MKRRVTREEVLKALAEDARGDPSLVLALNTRLDCAALRMADAAMATSGNALCERGRLLSSACAHELITLEEMLADTLQLPVGYLPTYSKAKKLGPLDKRYDPADIPVSILGNELGDGLKRERLYLIFKTGLVWDERKQRMLSLGELADLFAEEETWWGTCLQA